MDIGQINTLGKFLRQSGAKYRVFDMGRRVCKLTPEQFVSFDNCQRPYPYPFKRFAQIGIIFWHPQHAENQYVWFLQFPLDEQGLLIPDARDAFLMMLLERLGEAMLAAADGEKIQARCRTVPIPLRLGRSAWPPSMLTRPMHSNCHPQNIMMPLTVFSPVTCRWRNGLAWPCRGWRTLLSVSIPMKAHWG